MKSSDGRICNTVRNGSVEGVCGGVVGGWGLGGVGWGVGCEGGGGCGGDKREGGRRDNTCKCFK